MAKKGWNYKAFRKWALFLGGLVGFSVVLVSDLWYDKDVNYAIYVLLAGMMGLDSVLSRQEDQDNDRDITRGPPNHTTYSDIEIHRKEDPNDNDDR